MDRLWQTTNKDALAYTMINYPVASKWLVLQCFSIFHRRCIWQLGESHHISVCVCFGDLIISYIRLEKVVHGRTVRSSCGLALTPTILLFQCNAGPVFCCDGGRFMNKSNRQTAWPSYSLFISYANLHADRKLSIEIGSNKANILDRNCICMHLAYLATLWATS